MRRCKAGHGWVGGGGRIIVGISHPAVGGKHAGQERAMTFMNIFDIIHFVSGLSLLRSKRIHPGQKPRQGFRYIRNNCINSSHYKYLYYVWFFFSLILSACESSLNQIMWETNTLRRGLLVNSAAAQDAQTESYYPLGGVGWEVLVHFGMLTLPPTYVLLPFPFPPPPHMLLHLGPSALSSSFHF